MLVIVQTVKVLIPTSMGGGRVRKEFLDARSSYYTFWAGPTRAGIPHNGEVRYSYAGIQ